MRSFRMAAYLTLAVAGAVIWALLITHEPVKFGAAAVPEEQGLGVVIYGYLVTLVGVVLGSFYRGLQAHAAEGQIANFGAFVSGVVRSVDLWLGLFGSPIAYALIWRSLGGGGVSALTIIALQNGFCCTVLLGSVRPTVEAGGASR